MSGAWRWACLGVCLSLSAGPALAEPLTLAQALARAQEVSTELKLQELSSESAEARWLADPRVGAPSVRLGLRDLDVPTAINPTPGDPEVVTRLRIPFPRPWDLAAAAEQGVATVAREDAELDALRENLDEAVTRRFHALPLLDDAVTLATALTDLRAQHAALVAQRRAEGLATALDWLDSEESRRDADERRASHVAERMSVEAELRLLLAWPVDEPLKNVATDQSARTSAPPLTAQALREGLETRDPDVREADAEIARAEARLRRDRLASLPWVDWAQGGAVFKRDRPTSFEIGLAIDVPIYLWSANRTREARHELASARLEREQTTAEVAQRLARRVRAAAAAAERWEVEKAHQTAVVENAVPLLEVADPLLKVELRARIARAELRVLLAYAELVAELDRRDAEAHREN